MKIVGFGDFLIHFSPVGSERFMQTDLMQMSFTGAEANVCAALAYWGEKTEFVTCLPNHFLAQKGISFLKSLGIMTDNIPSSDARMGVYFLENGRSVRPSYVIYDRNDTAFTKSEFKDYNWNSIFENADILYLSGITPSLSESLSDVSLKMLQEARKRNIKVFLDINYRPTLASPEKAKSILTQLFPYITYLIGNEEHLKMILGITSSYGEEDRENRLRDITAKAQAHTGIDNVAVTVRRTISSDETIVYAAYRQEEVFSISPERRISVVDRVGSGDAFSAGLIYGTVKNYTTEECVNFASASCAMKHTITKDINFATVQEINNLINSNTYDVRR